MVNRHACGPVEERRLVPDGEADRSRLSPGIVRLDRDGEAHTLDPGASEGTQYLERSEQTAPWHRGLGEPLQYLAFLVLHHRESRDRGRTHHLDGHVIRSDLGVVHPSKMEPMRTEPFADNGQRHLGGHLHDRAVRRCPGPERRVVRVDVAREDLLLPCVLHNDQILQGHGRAETRVDASKGYDRDSRKLDVEREFHWSDPGVVGHTQAEGVWTAPRGHDAEQRRVLISFVLIGRAPETVSVRSPIRGVRRSHDEQEVGCLDLLVEERGIRQRVQELEPSIGADVSQACGIHLLVGPQAYPDDLALTARPGQSYLHRRTAGEDPARGGRDLHGYHDGVLDGYRRRLAAHRNATGAPVERRIVLRQYPYQRVVDRNRGFSCHLELDSGENDVEVDAVPHQAVVVGGGEHGHPRLVSDRHKAGLGLDRCNEVGKIRRAVSRLQVVRPGTGSGGDDHELTLARGGLVARIGSSQEREEWDEVEDGAWA